MPLTRDIIDSIAAVAANAAHLLLLGLVILGLGGGLFVAVPVQAQQPPPADAPAVEQQRPASRPGFLDTLGGWISDSRDAIGSGIRSTQDTLGNLGSKATGAARDAAGAAVDAASSAAAIPGTRLVSGRQLCPLSSNGAPDCQQGAEALCKGKGFQAGRHLEIASGQRCSVQAWWTGGRKRDSACRTETYVTRAICQ